MRDLLRRLHRIALFLPLSLLPAAVAAATASPAQAADGQPVLQVFVREGCPHCADAKEFLSRLSAQRPGLRIVYRSIDDDAQALDDLVAVSRKAGAWPPGVPTFVLDSGVLVGYDAAGHSGAQLLALVDGAAAPAGRIEKSPFGALDVQELGLPLFTLALGLLDGFNPCAMWVLLFLLALLVRLNDRRRMALVAGTFVLASGVVYYAFMAAWLNLFLALGWSEPLRWTLAGIAFAIGVINVKDSISRDTRPSLSIPAAAKPGLYARMRSVLGAETLPASLLAVAVLAVVVNFVELLCTAGFPAIYTAVLTRHDIGPSSRYAYLGLYILGYIADDALMVGTAVIALGARRLTQRAGSALKLVSGVVMLALALVMMLRPDWLL
jgi:glutaredoxin